MPSFDDVVERAADKPAFSNGTEGDAWMAHWCWRPCCYEETCPILAAALFGATPAEWVEVEPLSLGNQYRCTKFEAAP